MIAASCDSFNHNTNKHIRRKSSSKHDDTQHFDILKRVAGWCCMYGVVFKMNSVINTYNWEEDMSKHVRRINPARWKVFQCLQIEGKNIAASALRDALPSVIESRQFDTFVQRHRKAGLNPVPENNEDMKNSNLILDEHMRFLNCQDSSNRPTSSMLDGDVEAALANSGFDVEAFVRRCGKYEYRMEAYLMAMANDSAASSEIVDVENIM